MKLLLAFLVLFCMYIFFIKQSVVIKKSRVLKAFKVLDNILQKRYRILQTLIDVIKNNNLPQKSLAEYSEKLLAESISLGTKVQNIDRRIAYDKELSKATEQIIVTIKEDSLLANNPELKSIIEEYTNFEPQIKDSVEKYNTEAHILRTATDVFPSSFIARLSKIKYFDSI